MIRRQLGLHFVTSDVWEYDRSVIEAVVDENSTLRLIASYGC